MSRLNDTHDPQRRSWVESANTGATKFPIQNLPLGIFRTAGTKPRGGIAIGDSILDIASAHKAGLFKGDSEDAAAAAAGSVLNPLMALGNAAASDLRAAACGILTAGSSAQSKAETCLVPMDAATLELPARIGSFTDFLCSYDHTRRMSPDGSSPPAYSALPIAYHSRATTIRVSGTPLIRPNGQFRDGDGSFTFGPEPSQDFELELGIFVGLGNQLGQPITIEDATNHLFGYCLLNDWSARGIQFGESQPLGPFLGKSLMTTVSPWIVTSEALAPFSIAARERVSENAAPPHLCGDKDQANGGLDIAMTVDWSTAKMRDTGVAPQTVTQTNFNISYWTPSQMLTHHASNGCNLEPGDLFGSGTVSGPSDQSRACLAELTERGATTLDISGEPRRWLADGDEINFQARASRKGYAAIGFGDCRGRVEPALTWPSEK